MVCCGMVGRASAGHEDAPRRRLAAVLRRMKGSTEQLAGLFLDRDDLPSVDVRQLLQ